MQARRWNACWCAGGQAVVVNLDIAPVEQPETVRWIDPILAIRRRSREQAVNCDWFAAFMQITPASCPQAERRRFDAGAHPRKVAGEY